MPIYEYRCTKNGHRFEAIQKVDDPPLTECRRCSSPVEKLISRSSFVLKGSGFYQNDYAPKRAAVKETESSAETGKEKTAGKATDSTDTGDKEPAPSSPSSS